MNGETQTASFRHHTIRQNQPITGNGTGQTRTDITPRSRLFARIVLILTTSNLDRFGDFRSRANGNVAA